MFEVVKRDETKEYKTIDEAIKAAIKLAADGELGDSDVYVLCDGDTTMPITSFKSGVIYRSDDDMIKDMIADNSIDYIVVNSLDTRNQDSIDTYDETKIINSRINDFPIVRWEIYYGFPGSEYYVGDPDLADREYPGKILSLLIRPEYYMKEISDKDFVLNNSEYFSMTKVINDLCHGVDYERFKNWKSGKLKKDLSDSELRSIRRAMEKAAGK
jgi:hypothetical protein